MSRLNSNIVEIYFYADIISINTYEIRVLFMNRIRQLRKQVDMTQKELASHLQIADSTLSYWEMGKYEPDNKALMKLSRFFKVPIDYILGGDFVKWDNSQERVLYPGGDSVQLDDLNMSVSETGVSYSKTTAPNTTNELQNIHTAFSRDEFDGLTQDEINVLAEYAAFIKSRRKVDE